MISSVLKELSESAAESRLVTLVRRGGLEGVTAVPLVVGSRLVLLRTLNPEMLLPDGWVIVRVQDVVEVRTSDWNLSVERALLDEGLIPDPVATPAVRLDGWASVLADLHARGEPVSLECEDDEDEYVLGVLTEAGENSAQILPILSDGDWDDDHWTVHHEGLTRVCFGRRYLELFRRLAGDVPEWTTPVDDA